ncbi:MAG: bifunctional alpha,alpha-trehalose-phosphate synthase (UDP-forming)/trehalose-phosphatase [Dehalococcoidia bacterium]
MSRILIVSNRLPVTLRVEDDRPILEPSLGGLATGLASLMDSPTTLWIGWPGDLSELTERQRAAVRADLDRQRLVPVELTAEQIQRYYEDYSNGVIWPLFHHLPDRVPYEADGWEVYEEVNALFADAIARVYRPGDQVWIHDYQLMRAPALLRDRVPDAAIGFFLHIPFPSSEVFRTLPQRRPILEGLLGADLVGFHTATYMYDFQTTVVRTLGVTSEGKHLSWRGREVQTDVFPMGIDAASFAEVATRRDVVKQVRAYRQGAPLVRIMLGIDRLDYTKGIPHRLLAFGRMLETHPELRGSVRLVQVAVPSRERVEAYMDFRRQSDEIIGRINGTFGTPDWTPVSWINRSMNKDEIVALYRAADVMLVTPIRDGMNLVAKEFVASRFDEDGVLVLSEFAGAAAELAEAVQVNPFDIEGMAEAFARSLAMPADDRHSRMRGMRRRVFVNDTERWSRRFLMALAAASERGRESARALQTDLARLVALARATPELVLILDYDGTLVPFASTPELGRPDDDLLDLLEDLAQRPRTTVHVVGGRGRETLERWLGMTGVGLHAEHGVWSRAPGAAAWTTSVTDSGEWRERVSQLFAEYAASTPGSLVEEKTVGLAWYYRGAEPAFGIRQADALWQQLVDALDGTQAEVIEVTGGFEVRPRGINKRLVVADALRHVSADAYVVAIGDDPTDEDMFAALPDRSMAIHVGPGRTTAPYRLADVAEVRAFLAELREDVPLAATAAAAV